MRSKMKKSMAAGVPAIKESDRWKVENDLSNLRTAAEIMNDPKRMARCKALASKQMEGMEHMMGKEGGKQMMGAGAGK